MRRNIFTHIYSCASSLVSKNTIFLKLTLLFGLYKPAHSDKNSRIFWEYIQISFPVSPVHLYVTFSLGFGLRRKYFFVASCKSYKHGSDKQEKSLCGYSCNFTLVARHVCFEFFFVVIKRRWRPFEPMYSFFS